MGGFCFFIRIHWPQLHFTIANHPKIWYWWKTNLVTIVARLSFDHECQIGVLTIRRLGEGHLVGSAAHFVHKREPQISRRSMIYLHILQVFAFGRYNAIVEDHLELWIWRERSRECWRDSVSFLENRLANSIDLPSCRSKLEIIKKFIFQIQTVNFIRCLQT